MRINEPASHYDVVVVGGGMVGASFACALSRAMSDKELSVLVVESFAPVTATAAPGFDARSTALSYGSSQIYSQMGIWDKLRVSATPINEIHISDKGRFGSTCISNIEQRVEALGYVVENKDIGACLLAELDSAGNIDFCCPAEINQASPTPTGMKLTVTSQSVTSAISTNLLVLADGGKSPITKQLGISQQVTPYKQQALIANIAFEKPHNNIAFERFTDTGPLAVLPLATHEQRNRASLVWTLEEHQVAEFTELSESDVINRLQERFGHRLGQIQHIGARYCYPLSLSTASEQIRPGLVLLGNVAHTLHPVAGQGLNLALRDSQALVDCLMDACSHNQHIGSMSVLQQYVNAQQVDQDRTLRFTDYTTRLFSSNNSAKVFVRKAGLLAIDLLPTMRQEFARQAMGAVPKN